MTGKPPAAHLADPLSDEVAALLAARLDGLDGVVATDGVHHYPLRAQIEDTDAGGIIYHATYLNYAERARSAFLRCLDIRQEDVMTPDPDGAAGADGMLFLVRRCEIDYVSPGRLGQLLTVITRPVRLGGASTTLQQTVTNFENGHILARLLVDIVCVTADPGGDRRPRRMPSVVVDRLRSAMPPDTES